MRVTAFRASLAAFLPFVAALVLALPSSSSTNRPSSGDDALRLQSSKRALPHSAAKALSYRSPGSSHKLVVSGDGLELQGRLAASRLAGKVRRYDSFAVLEVSDQALASLGASTATEVQLRDDFNLVLLKRGQIDTTGPEPQLPLGLRQREGLPRSLQIVQLFGPPTPESVRELKVTGAKLVSYIPNNSYLVWATPAQLERVRMLKDADIVQWIGAYHPVYKLDPRINVRSEEQIQVSIELVDISDAAASLALIRSTARAVLMPEFRTPGLVHIKVLADSFALPDLARLPEVVAIEPWARLRTRDERANQIVAGTLSEETVNSVKVSRPARPGFLTFLSSVGLGSATDVVVDVADTGFDIGSDDVARMHPDFLDGSGASRVAYLTDYTSDSSFHGADTSVLPGHDSLGHGTLDASIVAGFNTRTGPEFRDALGFQYGLGVAPFVRVGITKLFDDNGVFERENSFALMYSSAYNRGARISTNSWGSCNPGGGSCNLYTADSTTFDALVRDVSPFDFGNQSMIFVFSSGNDGLEAPATIGSPATAKNVITVGATEGFRPLGPDGQPATDGCRVTPELSDNAMDVALFSSGGPVQDGRAKPDLVAPGTHIQGAATQDRSYASKPLDDIGVCDHYFPTGQTLYTWSSGTSHATPIVAGGAALAFQWLRSRLGGEPSPAFVKAFILNSTSYVTGRLGGDSLPGARQGWGLLNLARMFESTDRVLYDESPSRTFTTSGEAPFQLTGFISDPSEEFRVMLAWTDAPANPATNATYVNQLDLEVIIRGVVYNGNQFSGQYSVTGGQPDILNNVQGVRLPAGTTGPFVIRVRPAIIAGDGVPNNFIDLDQDFALVVTNGREAPLPVFTIRESDTVSDGVRVFHSNGAVDGSILPGETASLTVNVLNESASAAASITSATLTLGGSTASASYPTIDAGASASNTTTFTLRVPPDLRCGSVALLELRLTTAQGQFTMPVRVRVGRAFPAGPQNTLLNDDVDSASVRWKFKRGFGISSAAASSGVNSYHAVDPGRPDQDTQLSILLLKKNVPIPQSAGAVRLSFLHIFNFEPGFDGGVLEISTDDGATWQDLGSRILVGGYDGKVTAASNNPLGSRLAWTSRGRPGVFSQVVINLDDFAGQRIRLRFLAGFDEAVGILDGYSGWFIDDVRIMTGLFECR